jgi:hypothetical protein
MLTLFFSKISKLKNQKQKYLNKGIKHAKEENEGPK